jgi:clan AA aspartic protease (TIGR02281 family)
MNRIIKIITICLIMISNQLSAQILLTTSYENDLRANPDLSSSVLKRLPAHKDVELIDFISEGKYGGYFKVSVYGLIGYIHRNSVNYDDAYYLALKVKDGNVNEIYMAKKNEIDKLNKRKKYEEELWAKQNFKPRSKSTSPNKTKASTTINSSNNSSASNTSNPSKVIQMRKMRSGTFEIPCKVNGLALKFIFDTGASDVSISLTEALFMLKNGYLSEDDILGTQYYSIANGDIAEGTTIRIRKLEFGGLTLYNVDASIVHEMEAPLLLGQSAISRLGKIQIDPKKSTLTIIE